MSFSLSPIKIEACIQQLEKLWAWRWPAAHAQAGFRACARDHHSWEAAGLGSNCERKKDWGKVTVIQQKVLNACRDLHSLWAWGWDTAHPEWRSLGSGEPEAWMRPLHTPASSSGIPARQLCQVEATPAPGHEPEQGLTWEGHLLSSSNPVQKLLF